MKYSTNFLNVFTSSVGAGSCPLLRTRFLTCELFPTPYEKTFLEQIFEVRIIKAYEVSATVIVEVI